jgi:hypothetical protein
MLSSSKKRKWLRVCSGVLSGLEPCEFVLYAYVNKHMHRCTYIQRYIHANIRMHTRWQGRPKSQAACPSEIKSCLSTVGTFEDEPSPKFTAKFRRHVLPDAIRICFWSGFLESEAATNSTTGSRYLGLRYDAYLSVCGCVYMYVCENVYVYMYY